MAVLWHEREHRGTGKLRNVGAVCLLSRGSDAYLPPQQRRRGVRRRLLLPFAQPSREHSRGAGAPRSRAGTLAERSRGRRREAGAPGAGGGTARLGSSAKSLGPREV